MVKPIRFRDETDRELRIPPSTPRSRGEPVMQKLRRDILTGRYRPGDRLPPERELAERLGTNRNTLREALRMLEADNLVRARQGDGTIVLDWRNVGEINLLPPFLAEETPSLERLDAGATLLDLRSMLLEQIIPLVAQRGTESDWASIFEAYEELRYRARTGTESERALADISLYRTITLASHNLVLIWVFNTFSKVFVSLADVFSDMWTIDPEYLEGMQDVVFALHERKAEKAGQRLGKLLDERTHEIARKLGMVTGREKVEPKRRRK
jgi:GntR family transcriptional repressor for pyruvate dehydrogenase complex